MSFHLESILLLKYLDSNKLEAVNVLEKLEAVKLQSHCSFIALQLEMITIHFRGVVDTLPSPDISWESYMASVFNCAINQHINLLHICHPHHLADLMRKSSIVKNAFREQLGNRDESFSTFLVDLAATTTATAQSELSFYLSLLDNDENLDDAIVPLIFKQTYIAPIRKLIRLLKNNLVRWGSVVKENLQYLQLKSVQDEVRKLFEIESESLESLAEYSAEILKKSKSISAHLAYRLQMKEAVKVLEELKSIEEVEVPKGTPVINRTEKVVDISILINELEILEHCKSDPEQRARIQVQTASIFNCLKRDISDYSTVYSRLIMSLGKLFITNPPESLADLTTQLINIVTAKKVLTIEQRNLANILSLLSYTPEHMELFRCPIDLSSLDRAEELEDMEVLQQVLDRFKLFGYGNRKCFLSLWTSLQQLICSFSKSSSSLSMGSGREDEIDVLCGAVQGLAMLCLSSSLILKDNCDNRLYGCPAVCDIPKASRCFMPRQLISQIGLVAKETIQHFPNMDYSKIASLDLNVNIEGNNKNDSWLCVNPEILGPSTFYFTQLPSPSYFRSRGIAPTRLNETTGERDDLFDTSDVSENTNQSDETEVWSPDLESSTQFLFDLFLRWFHFSSLDSDEAPHRRVVLEACRSTSILISTYQTRQHFHETVTAIQCMLGMSLQNGQVRNEDPIINRVLFPILSKCCAVAGFENDVLTGTIMPLVSTTSENAAEYYCYYQSLLFLLDMPDGIVPGFKRMLQHAVTHLDDVLIKSNPSLLGLSPHELEIKVMQFSTALFLIEKYSDFAEEVEFTQSIVNFVCRSSKLGMYLVI